MEARRRRGRDLQRLLREVQGEARLRGRGRHQRLRAPHGQGLVSGVRYEDEPYPRKGLTDVPLQGLSAQSETAPAASRLPYARSPRPAVAAVVKSTRSTRLVLVICSSAPGFQVPLTRRAPSQWLMSRT